MDAGPPIEIPQQKKSHGKLVLALVIPAVIALGVGWACGRIFASRVMFNKTIDDAAQIQKEVQEIAKVNVQVAEVLHTSRVRNQGKIIYDEKLVDDLKTVLRNSPHASADKARKRQDQLFRTNYALMEGIVIERLFQYFNNTLRLMSELEAFIRTTDQSIELLKSYSETAEAAQRKYGIVFAEDKGNYYLAQLVEVGDIVCSDKKAKECRQNQIEGFMVRTGLTGSWTPRAGKPAKDQRITDIVIPIIPDENWRQVAIGKRGYLAFKDYVMRYGRLAAIAALLARDEKALVQDLGKASGREKLFTFGS